MHINKIFHLFTIFLIILLLYFIGIKDNLSFPNFFFFNSLLLKSSTLQQPVIFDTIEKRENIIYSMTFIWMNETAILSSTTFGYSAAYFSFIISSFPVIQWNILKNQLYLRRCCGRLCRIPWYYSQKIQCL